jgi:hypothetical protein
VRLLVPVVFATVQSDGSFMATVVGGLGVLQVLSGGRDSGTTVGSAEKRSF